MIAHEVHNEDLPSEFRAGEQVHVLQRKGRFPEGAHGHQAHAGPVMEPDAGLPEEVRHPLGCFCQRLKGAGEEMKGVLPGAHDGSPPPFPLQADSRNQAGQAATHYYSIEFHSASTCL